MSQDVRDNRPFPSMHLGSRTTSPNLSGSPLRCSKFRKELTTHLFIEHYNTMHQPSTTQLLLLLLTNFDHIQPSTASCLDLPYRNTMYIHTYISTKFGTILRIGGTVNGVGNSFCANIFAIFGNWIYREASH